MEGMKLTKREKQLITYGLFILETQCFGGDLHYEIEDELKESGGIPKDDEIRDLMDRIKAVPNKHQSSQAMLEETAVMER